MRRGHGDLHLGNIALIDGHPVPFDALEFDPVVASGDVLYDLAFLLMDLVERKLRRPPTPCSTSISARRGASEDLDALAALPLFMSLRAAIRAKVTAAKLAQCSATAAAPSDRGTRPRPISRSRCDLIAPPPPRLIAVGGLSGTGKSVLARALAPDDCAGAWRRGAALRRRAQGDVRRRRDREAAAAGLRGGRRTQRVYATLADKARRVVGRRSFGDRRRRVRTRARAHDDRRHWRATNTFDFRGLFLTADLATRVARVGNRVHDASDADAAVARKRRNATHSARWIGSRSMRRARRSRRLRAQGQR